MRSSQLGAFCLNRLIAFALLLSPFRLGCLRSTYLHQSKLHHLWLFQFTPPSAWVLQTSYLFLNSQISFCLFSSLLYFFFDLSRVVSPCYRLSSSSYFDHSIILPLMPYLSLSSNTYCHIILRAWENVSHQIFFWQDMRRINEVPRL